MPSARSQSTTRGGLKAQTIASVKPTALIASARNLKQQVAKPSQSFTRSRSDASWQEMAWTFYDTIDVYHYAVEMLANLMSRAKLTVLKDGKPTEDAAAVALHEAFFGGVDSHGEFFRQASRQFSVAGEGVLVAEDDGTEEEWYVASAIEVSGDVSSGFKIEGEDLAPNYMLMRFWNPHPRKRNHSDCATRALLPALSQLDQAGKYISAQLDSRLAGAGILAIPSEIVFPGVPVVDDAGEPTGETREGGLDDFIAELTATMQQAILDRQDASSLVPITIQVAGEHIDKIKHISFANVLDEHAPELREELIKRLSLGFNLPAEAITGTGEMNHWGTWNVDENLIKAHAEPMLKLLTASLTHGYLQPKLVEIYDMDPEEAAAYSFGSETIDMRLRPDRSKESLELHDRGLLSAESTRRENGFGEEDAMGDEERKEWLVVKAAQGSPGPEVVAAAFEALGAKIDLPDDMPQRGERPLPRNLDDHPRNELPAGAAIRLGMSFAAVKRAIERAGNRMRSTGSGVDTKGLRAMEVYRALPLSEGNIDHGLSDAWSDLDPEIATMASSLNTYTRQLMRAGEEHTMPRFARYLMSTGDLNMEAHDA